MTGPAHPKLGLETRTDPTPGPAMRMVTFPDREGNRDGPKVMSLKADATTLMLATRLAARLDGEDYVLLALKLGESSLHTTLTADLARSFANALNRAADVIEEADR